MSNIFNVSRSRSSVNYILTSLTTLAHLLRERDYRIADLEVSIMYWAGWVNLDSNFEILKFRIYSALRCKSIRFSLDLKGGRFLYVCVSLEGWLSINS